MRAERPRSTPQRGWEGRKEKGRTGRERWERAYTTTPSQTVITAIRAEGTATHARAWGTEYGAPKQTKRGHRPPSAVRSHDRPTPSRGANRKICSLGLPQILFPCHSPHRHVWMNGGNEQAFTHRSRHPRALGRSRALGPPTATTVRGSGSCSSPARQQRAGSDCGGGSDGSVSWSRPVDETGVAAALDKSGWARKLYFILNAEIVKDTEKDSEKCNQQPALTNVNYLAISPSVLDVSVYVRVVLIKGNLQILSD